MREGWTFPRRGSRSGAQPPCFPGWLATLDAERIAEHNIGLANGLRAGLEPARTAVVSVDLGARVERLTGAGIRVAIRAGHARFACHLYNGPEDVHAALEALDATP